ncbi:MAG: class I SAM-dependent methyltransferase [Caldithrix sp.]|nr:MAG: class I SAM-dependent methyltransferase [Caldithrix sp.]
MVNNLREQFGDIDIYLFDQLLKGRIDNSKRILDAGCGAGRNLTYFLKNGFDVYAIEKNHDAIERVKNLAGEMAPQLARGNFKLGAVENIPFADKEFDIVISNAVLHFATSEQHFDEMLFSMWRVLKAGGFLFVRLASMIGIENEVKPLGSGRYLIPDGSERYLVDQQMLLDYTLQLGGDLIENIKTTNVQNLRCMTTWCLTKCA